MNTPHLSVTHNLLTEIEKLRAQRDELREALKQIVRINGHEDYTYDQREAMIAEEARAVLKRTGSGTNAPKG